MIGALLLLSVVQLPSDVLRDTLRATQQAHEAGRSAEVRARWERSAVRAPTSPTPVLALALLDRLRYDYVNADRRAMGVLRSPSADRAARLHARLLLAGNAGARWQLREAELLYREARADALLVQDAVSTAEATLRMAAIRVRTENLSAALATLDTAEALANGDRPTLAAAACIRSQFASSAGDTAAVRYAEAGLALARQAGAARVEGTCLQALGQHWNDRSAVGASTRALAHFRAAESVQSRIGDLVGRAAARQWSGALLLRLGRLRQARDALEGAIADAERSDNRSVRAWAEMNMAALHTTLGDDATAYRHLTLAGRSALAVGDKRLQVQLLALRADVSLSRGDLRRARAELDSASRLSRALGDPTFAGRALGMRVKLARRSGDRDSALRLLDVADSVAASRGSTGFSAKLARASVMLELGRLDDADAALRSMPTGMSEQIGFVRRARGAEVAARRGDLTVAASLLEAAIDSLNAFRASLREPDLRLQVQQLRSLDQIDPDLGIATVLAALADGGRAEAAFTLGSRLRAHELHEVMIRRRALDTTLAELPGTPELADHAVASVRAALRSGEALIFLISGRHSEPTTAWVVSPAADLATVRLPMADSLEPLIRRFTDLLASGQPSDGLARRLGRDLLAPLVGALPQGTSRLIIAPDRPMLALPFEALVLPDGRPALDRFAISLVPSPSVFVALRRVGTERTARRGVLAIAQPVRGTHGPWRELPALPWAEREANGIVRAASSSQAVIGDAVRIAALRNAERATFAVLHLAAHAVVDEQVPARSAILLEPALGAAGELRLSEVEAMQLPFPLVVLSACRTVRGREVQGEGLRSLGAAFLQGGVQSVVGTAWDVEDERVAAAMELFYTELARGSEVGTALVLVKRRLRQMGRPPSEWAVLQLLGDPRLVPLGRR